MCSPDSSGDVLAVALVNQRSEVERLSRLVDRFGDAHGLSADDVSGLNLVLDEIVINVMRHGYDDRGEHQILVTLSLEKDVLTLEVKDDGRPFNPLVAPPPDLDRAPGDRPIGGLGIHIVRSTVDTMAYRREGGRNILTMTMKASGA